MKFRTSLFGAVAAGAVVTQTLIPITAYAATGASNTQYAKTIFALPGHPAMHPEHVVAKDPWSGKPTSWIPIAYLQEALQSVGIQTNWDNSTLDVSSTPIGWKVSVSNALSGGNPPAGQMQFSVDGDSFVRAPKLVAKDPASGADTTYVPVYYADLFLHSQLDMKASWAGSTWDLSPQQVTFTPPGSIQSLTISGNGIVALQYTPKSTDKASVIQNVLSWLKSAKETTLSLPFSTPGIRFQGNVGPARLHFTTGDNSQIAIYPAYTITAARNQGKYQVNYAPNVVAYSEGNHTTYLTAPKLYAWLKDSQWQTEFTSN